MTSLLLDFRVLQEALVGVGAMVRVCCFSMLIMTCERCFLCRAAAGSKGPQLNLSTVFHCIIRCIICGV